MAKTQKNKATSYHLGMSKEAYSGMSLTQLIGQLKAKLAKLKRELLTPQSSGGGGGCKSRPKQLRGKVTSCSRLRCCKNGSGKCGVYRISFGWEEHTHEQVDWTTF